MKKNFLNNVKGSVLMFTMVFGSIAFTVIALGVAGYAMNENKASLRYHDRDMAFNIAEAGINYYRWHLAHNQTDYKDGTNSNGPYIHNYEDKDGNVIGNFSLEITPPLSGSTVVTVKSTGWTAWDTNAKRAIQARMGAASLTNYIFLNNSNMSFSNSSVIHGSIFSNGGIRFDGTTDSWVRSAKDRYLYSGDNQYHNGIWGGGQPKSFWQYPVPAIDFYGVTADLKKIRDLADVPGQGIHLTSSGKEGYHFVFNGTQFALYKVNSRNCYNGEGRWRNRWGNWYWDGNVYCYDIKTETFIQNYNLPSNGAIFVEDDVWVEGTVDGRVSIGVGKFPVQTPYKKIYINDNLFYSAKASDDVVGLLAQGDIIIPHDVPNDMEINAALLSQFGANFRPYYDSSIKDSLNFFGSQISYNSSGYKYLNGNNGSILSGFDDTIYTFDGNLRFYPPPGFPVGTTYELLSWEEVQP